MWVVKLQSLEQMLSLEDCFGHCLAEGGGNHLQSEGEVLI